MVPPVALSYKEGKGKTGCAPTQDNLITWDATNDNAWVTKLQGVVYHLSMIDFVLT
jgi:hypothetical protein